ncbi:MAG: ATP-dependent DNA ligase [Nitriliruptor sp.]|nr:MAG: ATP-dependent DNA ligase [Nitriliruptor sp.]
MAAAVEREVDGRPVRISSPDKVIFPDAGLTKLDVVGYYLDVAAQVLPHCLGRPCNLKRYPDGVGGKSFMQKRVPASRPDWLRTAQVTFGSGRTAEELCPASMADVLWAVNLGAITVHPWSLRLDPPVPAADSEQGDDGPVVLPDEPDEFRIDLDPMPDAPWSAVVQVAQTVREVLDEHGIAGFVKTSGSTGVHVLVRIQPRPYIEVRAAAVALSREVERRVPDVASTSWWKEERADGSVFLDYNQNLWDRTTASAYAVRGRPDARVSLPVTWDELDDVDPADATIGTVPGLLRDRGDPMATLDDVSHDLEGLLDLAARDREAGLEDLPLPPHYPKFPNEPTRVPPSRAAE